MVQLEEIRLVQGEQVRRVCVKAAVSEQLVVDPCNWKEAWRRSRSNSDINDGQQWITAVRRRIEARIGQGQFLANLLHVAAKESSQVQGQFIDRLSRIATTVRGLMEQNDLISALSYRPREYWPTLRGNAYAKCAAKLYLLST